MSENTTTFLLGAPLLDSPGIHVGDHWSAVFVLTWFGVECEVAYVLEVTVIHSPYAQITYVNPLFICRCLFCFLSSLLTMFPITVLFYYGITFAFVICSDNKETKEVTTLMCFHREVSPPVYGHYVAAY